MLKEALFLLAASFARAATARPQGSVQPCPGYKASNIKEGHSSLTADLTLAGKPCNTYGTDLKDLRLLVEYQTDDRLHVMIHDADEEVYQVPESVLPRPGNEKSKHSALKFYYKEEPFCFSVTRGDEVLFDTSSSNLIFQSQYLNLRTAIPDDPYLYGLGEHSDAFRLESKNYTRTLWNRDAYGTPPHSNLYSSHPVYYDHRGAKGTHGVFLLNSNGMDIKIDEADDGKKYLEYNTLGGVFDFYFFNGETPKEASIEYSKIVGLPAMQSYWTFGYHQCKYGYQDVYEVAEVVYNYSKAGIPLETMWTDIDYMDKRTVFTLDEERYPLERVRELVDYLHDHDQHYIVMVDPAVGVSDNEAFNTALKEGILLHQPNGSLYKGVVWPGVAAFPDWFHPDAQDYWDGQFNGFFDVETGVDIDGLWIDMNEASNFCPYPCEDPEAFAIEAGNPPKPPPVRPGSPRPLTGFPADFQPRSSKRSLKGKKIGLPGRDLLDPPYRIGHAEGIISNKTINTDIVHAGEGYVEYDTHNIYGAMMSSMSRHAMQQRRSDVRPFIITRSTFAGSGTTVGHWLGDNLSIWHRYRVSIPQSLSFASMFQIPMVGADVCGFGANTTEELCARWARLGAFYTFFRNHNDFQFRPQEFYLWPTVTESAKKAIELRYRLLDYMYTAFYKQSQTGEPFLQPLFYLYPKDKKTFANEQQFFYGDSLLVSPVMEENATSVDAYFPDDIFYDWYTGAPVRGKGANITLNDIGITDIPVHIRGGSIIPVRASGANTTTELRKQGFQLVIAPGLDGKASGSLYLDDGDSIEQQSTLEVQFEYSHSHLRIEGQFGGYADTVVESVVLLGQKKPLEQIRLADTEASDLKYDTEGQSVTVKTNLLLDKASSVSFQ